MTATVIRVPLPSRTYDLRQYVQTGETLDATGGSAGNNSTILNRAVVALNALYAADGIPRQISVPNGKYSLAQTGTNNSVPFAVQWKSGVGLKGESEAGVVFLSDAGSTPFFGAYGSATSPLTDCQFENFTIDCTAQTNATYTTQLKGMFIQYMLRPRWSHVTIKNAWGTGLGCDYLQDAVIDHPTCTGNGRGIAATGVSDPSTVSGGSGIGIGTGYTQVERILITNPTVTGNGRAGIFFEKQTSVSFYSRGARVVGGVAQGNWAGLQDCGCDGLEADITVSDNTYGLLLDASILSPKAGKNGRVTVHAERNSAANVLLGQMPDGDYRVSGIARGATAGPGVLSTAASTLGPRILLDLNCDLNAGSGYFIQSSAPVQSLTIGGTARNNGQSVGQTYRDGVTVRVSTSLLTVTAAAIDDQATKTQQAGVALRGASNTATTARLRTDVRSNAAAGYVQEQTVTNDSILSLDGYDTVGPSALAASAAGDGTVTLTWAAPITTGDVTDYAIQYRLTSSGSWSTFAHTASNSTTQTVTGLTNGSSYTFQVAAVHTATGTSNYTAGPVTATPAKPPVVSDTFNRADSSASLGSTDGGSAGTLAWAVSSSTGTATWGIASNRAYSSAGTGFALVDNAATIRRVQATLAVANGTASRSAALVAAALDYNNRVSVSTNDSGGTALCYTLTKLVAGTKTVLAASSVAAASGDVVRLELSGITGTAATTVTLYVNGTQVAQATGVSIPTSWTKAGMGGNFVTDNSSRWDDFAVYNLA